MQTFQRCVTQNTSPTPCRSTCCAAYAGRGLRIGQQSASTLTGHTPQRRLFFPNSTSANAAHRRADIGSLTLAGRREHRECVAHRIMHRVRPCREAHCEEQRGDERADTTIAKREVLSNTCDDQNEQRKGNKRDPVDRRPIYRSHDPVSCVTISKGTIERCPRLHPRTPMSETELRRSISLPAQLPDSEFKARAELSCI